MTYRLPRDVSRETLDRLTHYASLLKKWNPKINLVSPKTLADLWTRHFVDSAQIFDCADEGARCWVDLGSGGGFPGAVVAILAAELAPEQQTVLIESDLRKSTFLRTVARETGVAFTILNQRIEAAEPQSADVVSARALAPLTQLLGYVERHLNTGGLALLPKGRASDREVAEALERWRFDCETIVSQTDPEAVILKIKEIERV